MPQNQAGSVYVPQLARTGEPGLKTQSQYDDENRARQAADQEQQLRAMTVSMAVEAQKAKFQQQKAQQEEQAWLSQAMNQYVHDNGRPDLDTVASEYERRYPQSGIKFREEVNKGRKSSIDLTNAELEMKTKVASTSSRMLKMATPENYSQVRAGIVQLDPQADGKLPPQFDPVALKSIIDQADAYTGAQSEQIKANELLKNGNVQESVAKRVGVIRNQKDLDDFYDDMSAMMDATAFKSLKNTYGPTYTGPDWNIRADQANLTADQRRQQKNTEVDDKRQAEELRLRQQAAQGGGTGGGGNTSAKVAAIIKNPAIWDSLTPTEKTALYVPLANAGFDFAGRVQSDGKPSNGMEKRALNFYNRAREAAAEIERIGPIEGKENLWNQTAGEVPLVGNALKTSKGQAYTQAQRQFTEARLRKDSGAAIPNTEFENDRLTYFRQVGDSPETIAQKERARNALLASLAFESGRALGEFYGPDASNIVEEHKANAKSSGGGAPSGAKAYTGEVRKHPDGRLLGMVDGKPVEVVKSGSGYVVK